MADDRDERRRLIYVPRMYTMEEIMLATGRKVSEDVKEEIEGFWHNLENQLSKFGRIDKVYRDMITADGEEGAQQLSMIDPYNFEVVKALLGKGAKLVRTEDPLLVKEAEAWVGSMARGSPSAVELFRENLRDRNNYISKRIDETLKPGETGILFIEPSRELKLPQGLEVVKVSSDSLDFLKRLIGGKKVD